VALLSVRLDWGPVGWQFSFLAGEIGELVAACRVFKARRMLGVGDAFCTMRKSLLFE
jgi:hypothetical protein